MSTYEKIDKDTIRKTTTIVEEIDLRSLKAELAVLESEKEPSEKELLEVGRMYHPFYLQNKDRINELRELIGK